MRKIVLHPFLFAIYPILALLTINLAQVNLSVAARPMIISLSVCSIIFLALTMILKSVYKAGLIVTHFIILYFSYGHLYRYLESSNTFSWAGHHRFLLPFFTALLVLGIIGILFKLKDYTVPTLILNWVGVILVGFSLVQIVFLEGKAFNADEKVKQTTGAASLLTPPLEGQFPDIYFIVLDMHTRSDVLAEKYDHDTSSFINALEEIGFYIANCSRSNYGETSQSITATLNMNYLDKITSDFNFSTTDAQSSLLKNSLVRSNLQSIGYQTVAFKTEYPWSELTDADYFISPTKSNLALRSINPFESLLIDSTVLLPLREYWNKHQIISMSVLNHPWREHVELVRFNLRALPEVPKIQQPKFVFVHLLVPHVPFVFAGDGSLRTDPRYWEGEDALPVDAAYEKGGYAGQVEFIDNQMIPILDRIISVSSNPPIIVIMGDHGFKLEDRNKIFNAYYFPDGDYSRLAPDITPVNSFRVIFDQFFGTQLGLITDQSFNQNALTFEDSPICEGN